MGGQAGRLLHAGHLGEEHLNEKVSASMYSVA